MRAAPTALAAIVLSVTPATARAQTVGQVAARRACSTAGVVALTAQLIETQRCMTPGALVRVTPHRNLVLTAQRINPFMQTGARDALWAASRTVTLRVNSLFRTLADQYVLYHSRACPLAAEPGESNHETGTAVDLDNWRAAQRALLAAGCRHTYPGRDDVHFDCPGRDRRADSVRAFQRLWNLNHPDDRIAENGDYGSSTAQRVARSPARGFPRHGCAQVAHVDAGVAPDAHEPHDTHAPRDTHDPRNTHDPHDTHEPHDTRDPHDTHEPHVPAVLVDAAVDAAIDGGIPSPDALPQDHAPDDAPLADASLDAPSPVQQRLDAATPSPPRNRGCACDAGSAAAPSGGLLAWLVALAFSRRRPYRRRR